MLRLPEIPLRNRSWSTVSNFIDADDVRLIVQSVILFVIAACAALGLAAVLGLAWMVFRIVGGV